MKLNVGGVDRILRIVVGAALVGTTALGVIPVWGYIGIIPLATGLIGFCPLYPILGFSSKK
jgi:hypothetical protein